MFEAAEAGRTVSKADYEAEVAKLRLASTRLDGETLWTLDGALKKAAKIVGVSLVS